MRNKSEQDLLFTVDPESAPFKLAKLDEGEDAFVSCYLDARGGKEACVTFLNQKAAQIRSTLRGVERFYFDSAIETILCAVEADWRDAAQGIALFTRGAADGRQLTMLQVATPLENRLVRYSVPEVLPLLALHQREPSFSLLRIEGKRLHLFESRLGLDAVHAGGARAHWSGDIGDLDGNLGRVGGAAMGSNVSRDAVWRFHKALGASSSPFFVAGSVEALSQAAEWLPRRAIERLVGSLTVATQTTADEVLETARRRLSGICCDASIRLADALTEAGDVQTYSALGYRSTLEALRSENPQAVVVADWEHPGLGLPWETAIEVCFEALRRGVPVVLADSRRLREAGGVGCLLREPVRQPVRPAGASNAGFEQVA